MSIRSLAETLAKAKYGRDEIWVHHRDPTKEDGRLREFQVKTMNDNRFMMRYGWWLRPADRWVKVQFGRNGEESDIGLSVCILGLHWFGRLKCPATERFRIAQHADKYWHEPRHTGFHIGYVGIPFGWEIDAHDNWGKSADAKWRRFDMSMWRILGRTNTERETIDHGVTDIPMPEGDYPASWEVTVSRRRYVRWPGKALNWWRAVEDRARTPRVSFDIPGGIPMWGKGDNSWDCGMDATFGSSFLYSGSVKDDAADVAVSTMRTRERTGMFQLPHPMTLKDAEEYLLGVEGPT